MSEPGKRLEQTGDVLVGVSSFVGWCALWFYFESGKAERDAKREAKRQAKAAAREAADRCGDAP